MASRSSIDRKSDQGKGDRAIGSSDAYRKGYDKIRGFGKNKEQRESERK